MTDAALVAASECGWLLCSRRSRSVRERWFEDCIDAGRPYVAVYHQMGAKTASLDYAIPTMTADRWDPRFAREVDDELGRRIGAAVQASPSREARASHGALWGFASRIGANDACAIAAWLVRACARPESFGETVNPMLPDGAELRPWDRLRFDWVPEGWR